MTSVENTYKNCNTLNPNPKYCPTIPLRAHLILLTTFNRKKRRFKQPYASMCGRLSKSHFAHVKCETLALLPNPRTPPQPPSDPSSNHHSSPIECTFACVSVICAFQSYGDTAETITKPRPEPQSKQQTIQSRNHSRTNPKPQQVNQAWNHSRTNPKTTTTAKPIPQPQPKLQPNQSHNRSRNYPAPPRVGN